MGSGSNFIGLVECSYGRAEASRAVEFTISSGDLENVCDVGVDVLRNTQPVAGACAYMAAIWTAILRERHGLPAYCVAGDLLARGLIAFGGADLDSARHLGETSRPWDGHCWLAVGDQIGELSVFRIAYSLSPESNLRRTVLDAFGPGRGLYLGTQEDALAAGLEYRPRHVLREAQLDVLIQSARHVGVL